MAETEILTIDGIDVEIAKPGKQVVDRLIGRLERQVADAQAKLQQASDSAFQTEDKYAKDIQARDAKIKALEHEVLDTQPTSEEIAQMVSEHQKIKEVAGLILGRDATLDGQSIEEMHRTVVAHRMGAAAKEMNDVELRAAFEALRAVAGVGGGTTTLPASHHVRHAVQENVSATVRDQTVRQHDEQAQRAHENQLGGRRKRLYEALREGRSLL